MSETNRGLLCGKVNTLPTAEILSGKNVRAWVSMLSYLKKEMKIKILKRKKSGAV